MQLSNDEDISPVGTNIPSRREESDMLATVIVLEADKQFESSPMDFGSSHHAANTPSE